MMAAELLALSAAGCREGGAARSRGASRVARAQVAPSGNAERQRAEADYAFLQAQLQLAQKDKPYLVFDWDVPSADLMLKGAVVAQCSMKVDGGDGDIRRFRERFRDDGLVMRGLVAKRLFTSQKQTPDSVLSIVGPVLNLSPEILQRHIPGWFEFNWGDDLVLEVHSDVAGKPEPGTDLRMQRLRGTLRRASGETRLKVTMDRRDALTLYRVARTGLPTLSPVY